ncbi:hypothetical protein [Cutibacterium modestum]|uniref:hypothetical protein n=1 Tax=Cutibacterium modestum TaxID=2559073 RepID=UPI001D0BFB64|nr:hypothetical protein [Cutibacterium modestum]
MTKNASEINDAWNSHHDDSFEGTTKGGLEDHPATVLPPNASHHGSPLRGTRLDAVISHL